MNQPMMAAPISEDSWLNEPRFAAFVSAYHYASVKTRAIPALSQIAPEDAYYVWLFIQRGMERHREQNGQADHS
jgi:hypothetical protein